MKFTSLTSQPSSYTPPTVRNILLGILLCLLILASIGYLAEIVKGCGYLLLYIPARLGMIQQVSPTQIQALDFSNTPTEVDFSVAGEFVVYTVHYDLLMTSDLLAEEALSPWLRIISLQSGTEIEIEPIRRGLMPQDTPFAKGRPIYFFQIPQAGSYRLFHPTYPGAMVYFAQYDFYRYETSARRILTIEAFLFLVLTGGYLYVRYTATNRHTAWEQNQNRQRAEALFKLLRTGSKKRP